MARIGWYVIRPIARICLWGYYRLFRVRGAERVPTEGPLLLVANHPNALVDSAALLVAVPRPLSFVAGRSVLTMPFLGWTLRTLGLAPVLRLGDGHEAPAEGNRLLGAFTHHLRAGGAAVLFPEGRSHVDPEVKAIRPGAAGIALDAETAEDFTLGLAILPVGLHYEPRQRFRGEAHVHVGEPFGISDLKDVPRAEAVRAVKERIAASLTPLVVHLERVDLEPLVLGIAQVYDEHQRADAAVMAPRPRGEVVRLAAACLNHFLVTDPAVVDLAQRRLSRYERLSARAGLEGAAIETHGRPVRSWLGLLVTVVAAAVGFPAFLVGLLTGYVPYRLTDTLARHLAKRRHQATLPRLRIVTAAVVFGAFWGLLAFLVYRWSHSARIAASVFAVCLGTSLFARVYAEHLSTWWARLKGLGPTGKRGLRRVSRARREVLGLVDDLAARYREETGEKLLPDRRIRWHQRFPWRVTAATLLTAVLAWFAAGFLDRSVEEMPSRSSPWGSLEESRARATLNADARTLVGLLDTLKHLEEGTYELKARFDAGDARFTEVADDRAIRRALLTYLNCRSELYRLAWFYRSPDRPRHPGGSGGRDPTLSDPAFVLSYAAAIELVRRGMQLVAVFDGSPNAIRKLNEGDQAWGLPPDTYDRVRRNLANFAIYDELADAMVRYDRVAAEHEPPTETPWARIHAEAEQGRAVIQRLSDKRWKYKWEAALARAKGSAEDARYAASSFFAGLIGGVRIREGDLAEGLIDDAQVAWLQEQVLEPGDILLERRNWALSNVFLPGFWTHAALYVGGAEGVRQLGIEDDERVRPHLEALARPGEHGRARVVLEALAPGVVLSTLEHSVGEADAVCVLRPRLDEATIGEAVANAIRHHGKPYDFDFDFFSSDRLVCTELVYRAYQGPLQFDLETIMGRETLPALAILEKWARERDTGAPELDLVCFLDSDEDDEVARVGDAQALLQTCDRPGMTLLRPDVEDAIWPRVAASVLVCLFVLGLVFLRKRV